MEEVNRNGMDFLRSIICIFFAKRQLDMNWEDETTGDAVYNSAVEFWLDSSLDGLHIDTVNLYSKEQELSNAQIRDHRQEFQIRSSRCCFVKFG